MLIEQLTNEVNTRFNKWSFIGSIVDWYYFNGQIVIKDFDILTSDPFEPQYICPTFGPRMSWKFLGRSIDIFSGEPTSTQIPTVDERLAFIEKLRIIYPNREERYLDLIRRYNSLKESKSAPVQQTKQLPVCPNLGEQVETMICNICGEGKGSIKPVFACSLHEKCTPRQVRHAQKSLYGIHVCFGCEDGPESFK